MSLSQSYKIDPVGRDLFKWFDQVRKVFPGARVRLCDGPWHQYQVEVELQTYGYPTYHVSMALHREYLDKEDYLKAMLQDITRQLAYKVLESKQL